MANYVVEDIREIFLDKYLNDQFILDKTGVKIVELIGYSFIANKPSIFGALNEDYIKRELAWYESCSLNVNDIPGEVPKIWKQVATPEGLINSNYGWCIYHPDNGYQYDRVKEELLANPNSRRASMIYTRPSMHIDYNYNGMSDFMCTECVDYFIRDNKLHAVVKMRSNDAWAGYRNDFAWQKHILDKLSVDLEVSPGNIIWTASSLHLYERDFWRIEAYSKTGRHDITKKEFNLL